MCGAPRGLQRKEGRKAGRKEGRKEGGEGRNVSSPDNPPGRKEWGPLGVNSVWHVSSPVKSSRKEGVRTFGGKLNVKGRKEG